MSSSLVHEYVRVDVEGDSASLSCAVCGSRLCAADQNYREAAKVVDVPIESLGPLFEGLGDTLDERIVFRGYHCPSCGHRLDAEVCPESAEALWDLQLADPKGGR